MVTRHPFCYLGLGLVVATSACAERANSGSDDGGGRSAGSPTSGDRAGGEYGGATSGGGGQKVGADPSGGPGGGGTRGNGAHRGNNADGEGGSGGEGWNAGEAGQSGSAGGPATKNQGGMGGAMRAGPDAAGGKSSLGIGGKSVGSGGRGTAAAGSSDTGGAGASKTESSCSITIKTKALSTAIPTVGIVEWSTDLSDLTEASIEFGLDNKYGLTAPVDLKEASYRTLLLGLKSSGQIYHFRVVAKAGDRVCTGEDNTLPATGKPPNGVPLLTLTPPSASGLDGGFLVLETFQQSFGADANGTGYAFIIDGDGDVVWWYPVKGAPDLSRAKQSYDGKYMWITNVNVMSNNAKTVRVKMDGTGEEDLSKQFGNTNHDFAVRSDETIAFISYGSNGCDDIKERSATGSVSTIINSGTAVGASACHCNALQYDRNDDTIVFSELDTSSLVKVSRETKKVVWLMSSQNTAKATVTGMTWQNEHNIHVIDATHLLFFNNGTGPNATALEAELSISGGKGVAKQAWSYPSTLTVQFMGDVQRLPNGNTLVTYSTAGEIREVSAAGTLLQTIKGDGAGNLFGFAEKRKSLYGPPPR